MKEISFKLISNGKEIINEKTSYYEKDNTIYFCIKGDVYKFDKKNVILRKKDQEKELVIKINEKVIIIEVIKEGISFDYPINVITTEISDSKVFFSYSLDSEEELENTIIIEF